MNLHNKKFVAIANHEGLSSNETIFQYFQNGNTITGNYSGGAIVQGNIIGRQTSENTIELLYHCITTTGELKAGDSYGTIECNKEGKYTITFRWNWLNGNKTGGISKYIEIDEFDNQ